VVNGRRREIEKRMSECKEEKMNGRKKRREEEMGK
jgi:hypothetical protein